MIVNINYQVVLRSNNTITGSIKARVGQSYQSLKLRVLQQEGIKNVDSFVLPQSDSPKITSNLTSISLLQQVQKRKSVKDAPSRKMSEDNSVYQISSMDYEDEAKEFLAVQPEKPPIVRGRVLKCNSFLCCFSSTLYLQLDTTELNIYGNERYEEAREQIRVNDIKQLRSYRKKDYFFIKLTLMNNEAMDIKFSNKNLCKQWMGYITQSMQFTKFLNEKRIFSKADSFKNFMKSLNDKKEKENARIVVLEETNKHLETIYEQLPEEKVIQRESKHIVKIGQFDIKWKIGKGTFSTIYFGQRNNQVYALKQLRKEELLLRNQMKYALTELKTLVKCRKCKYIIPLYYAFQTPDHLYLALEYLPTGDLSQRIKNSGIFKPEQALIIIAELVYTIEYLHKQKIIYRDLKPENIMLDTKGHIYLIDFGLAKQLDNQDDYAESFLGTPFYLAPERFQEGGGSINYKSDIYGVGCTFYEMLHGQTPFHSTNYHSLINRIKNDLPEINKELPEDFIFFLRQTLEKDPSKRISVMSQHKIFKNVNWKQIAQKSHKGIAVESAQKGSSISLNYRIDEDYNELTFPLKLISDWQFNYETAK